MAATEVTVAAIRRALVAAIQQQRDFRWERANEYPEDARNAASAVALDMAADYQPCGYRSGRIELGIHGA